MVKRKNPIFLKVFIAVVALLLIEGGVFFYVSFNGGGFSGFVVQDVVDKYQGFNPIPKTLLMVQWAVLGLLLIFVYIKNIGIHKKNNELDNIHFKEASEKSKTELDALYLILKEKKNLSIKGIAKIFKIEEGLAMEWARILEGGDLATIDYPGFGSPVVHLLEESKEEQLAVNNEKMKEVAGSEKIEKKGEEKSVEAKSMGAKKSNKKISRKDGIKKGIKVKKGISKKKKK